MSDTCPVGSTEDCRFFRTTKFLDPKEGTPLPFNHPEVSQTEYCIPHIKHNKLPLGIALSGGGFRAATCANGFIRGLHLTKLDDGCSVLSKAQYLSSTSGGSWFNAAFSYKNPKAKEGVPLGDFLGQDIEVSELTKERLKQPHKPGTFEQAIAVHNTVDDVLRHGIAARVAHSIGVKCGPGAEKAADKIFDVLLDAFCSGSSRHKDTGDDDDDDDEEEEEEEEEDDTDNEAQQQHQQQQEKQEKPPEWVQFWTRAVTKAFLAPFGLGVYSKSTVSAANTTGDIAGTRAAKAATHVLLACTDKDRPYPIMTGTASDDNNCDGFVLYPLEFAPLSWGTPGLFCHCDPPIGGGFMEPWGLHAKPGVLECDKDECTGTVKVSRDEQQHTVPLAQVVAISSGFLAAATHHLPGYLQRWASTEHLLNWGMLPNQLNKVPVSRMMGFADGGALDNLAVMPLLRRGVKCLIVLAAASHAPGSGLDTFAEEANDVAALFGAAQSSSTPEISAERLNEMSHVFGRDEAEGLRHFEELYECLATQLRDGKPGHCCGTYYVKANRFFHVPPSTEPVEVLWIFNQRWSGWEAQLPKETQNLLAKDRGAHSSWLAKADFTGGELWDVFGNKEDVARQTTLRNFPNYTTYALDYSDAAVRLLSHMHTDIIKDADVKAEIKKLVHIAEEAKRAREGGQPPAAPADTAAFSDQGDGFRA